MEIINAVILGIIQGLTEFLPVSSSGHLEIAKELLGEEKVAQESMMMTVVLHFATALATILVFREDVLKILKGLLCFKKNDSFNFSLKIIISMIPAGLIGFFFNDTIEGLFGEGIASVGIMLIITGLLLFLADQAKPSQKNVDTKSAFLIGIAQAIAILPGISRSGATISTAVILGIDKEKSAHFSFLMVVPLILGKMAHDILFEGVSTNETHFTALIVGFISAFLTGAYACTWMIKIVKNSKLKYFSYYCFVVGICVISITFL